MCPEESKGSAKYTGTKTGPKRFDIYGIDAFKEGEPIPGTDKVSKGLPRDKNGTPYKDIQRENYKERIEYGEEHIVNKKKKRKNCFEYRKKKSPKCENNDKCSWVKSVGCRKKKDKREISEERRNYRKEILEISSDDSDDDVSSESSTELTLLEKDSNIKHLKKIGNLPEHKQIYIYFNSDSMTIEVIIYDAEKGNKQDAGRLIPLVKDIEIKQFKNLDYLDKFVKFNGDKLEFVPIPKVGGGDVRLSLNINTSNGDVLYGSNIVGIYKDGVVTIF